MRRCRVREREDRLSDDHGGTKEKVAHIRIVTEDCVDDADFVEIGEFGLSLSGSNPPFETKRIDDVLHTLGGPVYERHPSGPEPPDMFEGTRAEERMLRQSRTTATRMSIREARRTLRHDNLKAESTVCTL